MNAEDIIQSKNWQELTEAEKNSVATLAASEGEYNILKKLLLIAKEDANDLPAIDPGVRVNLHAHLEKTGKKKSTLTWWLAAASVIGIVLTVLFLRTTDHHDNLGSSPRKNFSTGAPERIDSNSHPSITQAPQQASPIKNNDTRIVDTSIQQKQHLRKIRDSEPSSVAQLSIAVSNNQALLQFVTEVY